MAANSIDHRGPCNLGLQANLPITLTDGMSEDAQLHKFDQLLIFKLDRLGRDTRLILNTVSLDQCSPSGYTTSTRPG